jgi:small nuclear ribonucleoprotein (snRNP)-like protein
LVEKEKLGPLEKWGQQVLQEIKDLLGQQVQLDRREIEDLLGQQVQLDRQVQLVLEDIGGIEEYLDRRVLQIPPPDLLDRAD